METPDRPAAFARPGATIHQNEDPQSAENDHGNRSVDPGSVTAQLFACGLSALGMPKDLWTYLEPSQRKDLAHDVIKRGYAARNAYPRRMSWLLAPELELLDRTPEERRPRLAEEMLRQRVGITSNQAKMQEQRANMAEAEVALTKQVIEMAKEVTHHMRTWRELAKHGRLVLWVATAFSMIAMIAVGVGVAYRRIDGLTAALLVFVLALFAASPSVLLLRERPLQGVDQWMPGSRSVTEDAASTSDKDKPEAGTKSAQKSVEAGAGSTKQASSS